jgi:AcrR family transcriptional regulator
MNEHSFINIGKTSMADRESRRKKNTAQRREQILKAAMEVFSKKGYAAATIPEIAAAAGLAAGTIYLYFPSKRELFIAVIKNFIITTPLLNLINKIPQGNIDAVFKKILLNRFDLIKSTTMSRIPSLIGEVQRDPELKALWAKQFIQPFLARMETGYRFMVDTNKFRRMEPAVAARAVGGMILGFLMLRIMEGDASPLERLPQDKVTDDMANLVLHGLLAGTGEKPDKDGTI